MKKYFLAILVALVSLISNFVSSEIVVDGFLNEKEWGLAQKITKFYEVYPYSLEVVEDIKTEILIYEDERGIYFGFKNFQPSSTMRIKNHLRDDEMSITDKTGVAIDFDGDGINAYQFFISSSGSIGDATVRNETERNWDWDADWSSASSIDEDVWYSELFIPWSVASMKTVTGEKRSIKLAFYRLLMGLGRGVSTIKGSPNQSVFLSVFDEFKVNNFITSFEFLEENNNICLLYTSPSPRD